MQRRMSQDAEAEMDAMYDESEGGADEAADVDPTLGDELLLTEYIQATYDRFHPGRYGDFGSIYAKVLCGDELDRQEGSGSGFDAWANRIVIDVAKEADASPQTFDVYSQSPAHSYQRPRVVMTYEFGRADELSQLSAVSWAHSRRSWRRQREPLGGIFADQSSVTFLQRLQMMDFESHTLLVPRRCAANIVARDVPIADIGIGAAYTAQVRLLRAAVSWLADCIQGQELVHMIYDLTVTESLGFTADAARQLLGVSRACASLILVGNHTSVAAEHNSGPARARFLKGAYHNMYVHCSDNGIVRDAFASPKLANNLRLPSPDHEQLHARLDDVILESTDTGTPFHVGELPPNVMNFLAEVPGYASDDGNGADGFDDEPEVDPAAGFAVGFATGSGGGGGADEYSEGGREGEEEDAGGDAGTNGGWGDDGTNGVSVVRVTLDLAFGVYDTP
ncbi:hypothetical protein GQ44DRAFT_725312 [Phaeosphaeriaceae sp. PMI808]|nr:hypothetical protein GQ44DRAFT_725312 [Phaeosphaeriaceae sp. PMI808]